MDHVSFMSKLHGPRFVWMMASGLAHPRLKPEDERPLVRSARTRARNAQRAIDRLVLDRARTICAEHDHGPVASCNWLCDLTAEQREEYTAWKRRYHALTEVGVR